MCPFNWYFYILPWPILKVEVMHISTVNSQMMPDRADITIAPNIMSHIGFRLAYLELTLTCSKGQLGHRYRLSPYILDFLSFFSAYCAYCVCYPSWQNKC